MVMVNCIHKLILIDIYLTKHVRRWTEKYLAWRVSQFQAQKQRVLLQQTGDVEKGEVEKKNTS